MTSSCGLDELEHDLIQHCGLTRCVPSHPQFYKSHEWRSIYDTNENAIMLHQWCGCTEPLYVQYICQWRSWCNSLGATEVKCRPAGLSELFPFVAIQTVWIYHLRGPIYSLQWRHYKRDASQITGVSIVYSTVCSGADQRKHLSSASVAFARERQRSPVNSPHKGQVKRKM